MLPSERARIDSRRAATPWTMSWPGSWAVPAASWTADDDAIAMIDSRGRVECVMLTLAARDAAKRTARRREKKRRSGAVG